MPTFAGESGNSKQPKKKVKFEAINIKNLEDFNNFYRFLPGGFYRNPDNKDDRDQQIIKDLDKKAQELKIDTESLFKKMVEGQSKVWEKFKTANTKEEKEKLEIIADEGHATCKEVTEKLRPLFKALVELGYTVEELKR